MIDLFDSNSANSAQKNFWKWQCKKSGSISCQSYKDNKALKNIVEKFTDNYTCNMPQIKDCYNNALKITLMEPNKIKMIVGYFMAADIVPIQHAWNYYAPANIYFDLTAELALYEDVSKKDYLKIINTSTTMAIRTMSCKEYVVSGFIGTWYQRNQLKQLAREIKNGRRNKP
jgi:hypothetical protein